MFKAKKLLLLSAILLIQINLVKAQDVEISIENKSAQSGEMISVPLSVAEDLTVTGGEIYLSYNSDDFKFDSIDSNFDQIKTAIVGSSGNNINIVWASISSGIDLGGKEILTVKLEAKNDAMSDLLIREVKFYGSDGNEIAAIENEDNENNEDNNSSQNENLDQDQNEETDQNDNQPETQNTTEQGNDDNSSQVNQISQNNNQNNQNIQSNSQVTSQSEDVISTNKPPKNAQAGSNSLILIIISVVFTMSFIYLRRVRN